MSRLTISRAACRALLLAAAAACADDTPTGPSAQFRGELLVITSIPDQSGVNGSSFVQTADLATSELRNTDAFEQTFFPYVSVSGGSAIVTQGSAGDQAVRYVRGADGRLTLAGRLSLPPGGFGASAVLAGETKGYVAVTFAGKIVTFDPRTMTATGEINLTALGIARNPSNPGDRNPEPAVLAVRDGKLYVALQQLVTAFSSADGADVAVFDVATDRFERVIRDTRAAGAGRYGYNQTMFVDEQGDLYVYCVASFGAMPGQRSGILRIRRGATEFDPGYFVSVNGATVGVTGGRIETLNGIGYAGNGTVYAIAQVPALQSNPPNYATDRAFQPVRIDLRTGRIDALPLPLSNGISAGVTFVGGKVVFGLSTRTGIGLYTYDPTPNVGSDAPVVRTTGDPTAVLAFAP
jgi:hypothetical protein